MSQSLDEEPLSQTSQSQHFTFLPTTLCLCWTLTTFSSSHSFVCLNSFREKGRGDSFSKFTFLIAAKDIVISSYLQMRLERRRKLDMRGNISAAV